MADAMSLAELAEETGIPARTIRYYIAQGLVGGPEKSGRGAVYTKQHRARLEQIKALQTDGRTLSDIALALAGAPQRPAPQPSAWWQFAIGEDVVIWARADASPWRQKQIRNAIGDLAARLAEPVQ